MSRSNEWKLSCDQGAFSTGGEPACWFISFLTEILSKAYLRVYRGGRVDFCSLENVVGVTSRGYLTLYLTVRLASALERLQDTLRRIGEMFLPFTGGFSVIRYRAVNLHFSGRFSVNKSTLFTKLKTNLEKQSSVEIVLGCGQSISRFQNVSDFPVYPFLYTYIQLKLPEGKLNILYTGSYTILTNSFKYLVFWTTFAKALCHGDSSGDSI